MVDLPTVANALIFQATIIAEANNFLDVSSLYFLIAVFIFSTTTISLTWFSSHHHRKQTTFFVFLSFSFSYFPFFLSVYSIRELNFLMFHFTVEMFYLGKVSFFYEGKKVFMQEKGEVGKSFNYSAFWHPPKLPGPYKGIILENYPHTWESKLESYFSNIRSSFSFWSKW